MTGRLLFALCCLASAARAQTSPPAASIVLHPAAVFDGQEMHAGWAVVVTRDKIVAAGPNNDITAAAKARTIELPGQTLMAMKGPRTSSN